jgi:hypothetical protein
MIILFPRSLFYDLVRLFSLSALAALIAAFLLGTILLLAHLLTLTWPLLKLAWSRLTLDTATSPWLSLCQRLQ